MSLTEMFTIHTKIYANRYKELNSPVTNEEVVVVLSILLQSRYCKVPYRELYWYASPDIHNESVSKSVTKLNLGITLAAYISVIILILDTIDTAKFHLY